MLASILLLIGRGTDRALASMLTVFSLAGLAGCAPRGRPPRSDPASRCRLVAGAVDGSPPPRCLELPRSAVRAHAARHSSPLTPPLLSYLRGSYQAVLGVPPALHSPLMSATNAISGMTAVGAMFLLPATRAMPSGPAQLLGAAALVLSAVNIAGGTATQARAADECFLPPTNDCCLPLLSR